MRYRALLPELSMHFHLHPPILDELTPDELGRYLAALQGIRQAQRDTQRAAY